MTLFTVTVMFGIYKGPSTLPEMKMLMLLDISMSRQIHKKLSQLGYKVHLSTLKNYPSQNLSSKK